MLNAHSLLNLNFHIEIKKDKLYYPIVLAASKGNSNALKVLLENPGIDVESVDEKTGTNAFWIACFFGHQKCAHLLSEAGCNIFVVHKETRSNALHIAIERKHYNLAMNLITSNFPLDKKKKGGFSALNIAARDLKAVELGEVMIEEFKADVNDKNDAG